MTNFKLQSYKFQVLTPQIYIMFQIEFKVTEALQKHDAKTLIPLIDITISQ